SRSADAAWSRFRGDDRPQFSEMRNGAPACASEPRGGFQLVIRVELCQYRPGPQRGSDVQGESSGRTFVPAAAGVINVPGAGARQRSARCLPAPVTGPDVLVGP